MSEHITITGLSYGTSAIGRTNEGKVVFVDGAVPGDVVAVDVTKDTKSYCEGTLVSILEPSPKRTTPACPMAGICGGCPWMHVDYAAQCEAKRANVVNQLNRIGGKSKEEAEALVGPCQPSKRELGYRTKLEFNTSFDKAGQFHLGFMGHKGNELVEPKVCPLGVRVIEKSPGALRGALRYLQGTRDLGIFRIGVRGSLRTKEVEVALWTPPSSFPRKAVADTLSSALNCTSIVRVMADQGKARKIKGVESLYGKGCWSETLCDTTFKVSAPSFFQVNTAQAEYLVEGAIESLGLTEHSTVADLYCGVGTFTLPLAKRVDNVFAVESAASSVRDLRRNAELSQVYVDVIGGDSARELPKLGNLDALIVDPPRAGLSKGVPEDIASAGPLRVAYISCDPATWARDVARFDKVGYKLIQATPVDLFPQTYHVETLSILERK